MSNNLVGFTQLIYCPFLILFSIQGPEHATVQYPRSAGTVNYFNDLVLSTYNKSMHYLPVDIHYIDTVPRPGP